MRPVLLPALVVATIYTVVATWLLVWLTRNTDGEGATYLWLLIGAPWIWSGILGGYYWLAVPLNGLTLYFLIVLGFAAYRAAISK